MRYRYNIITFLVISALFLFNPLSSIPSVQTSLKDIKERGFISIPSQDDSDAQLSISTTVPAEPADFSHISTLDSLLSILPAHFTAHYIASSAMIDGSLFTEELNRTSCVGIYNLESYVGSFTTSCKKDFLCSNLTLLDTTAYFLDCDTLISLDQNAILAAFPVHDFTLTTTSTPLADKAIDASFPLFNILCSIDDQHASLNTSHSPSEVFSSNPLSSDLTLDCTHDVLNIITINTLDTPGTLTLNLVSSAPLIIRTTCQNIKKQIILSGYTEKLIWLINADTCLISTPIYGCVLAPSSTLTIEGSDFYGCILCENLITDSTLHGVIIPYSNTSFTLPLLDTISNPE